MIVWDLTQITQQLNKSADSDLQCYPENLLFHQLEINCVYFSCIRHLHEFL
jgi:hypothetical protein